MSPAIDAAPAAVAVIGNGDVAPGSAAYALAESVGELLVDAGFRLVTGGLGGVMEAACRGGRRARRYQPGATVGVLPGDDAAAANRFVDVALPTGLGHGRNAIVARADAVVAIGGGAGTLAELAFAWIFDRLVVALRRDGLPGWSGRLAGTRLDERIRFPAIADDQIFAAASPEEAVALIAARLPQYRSAR
jgi:uncharacterized protein (TIGR00725 family)